MQRKLATVVCAYTVAYSRLIGLDEGGMIARLKANRRGLIDPTVAVHGSGTIKTIRPGLGPRPASREFRGSR